MSSGSGKTVVTCGLLALLKKRGYRVRSVKCGPDYIDPMFHREVLGVPGTNADLFLMGEESVRHILAGACAEESDSRSDGTLTGSDSCCLTIAEGAMGFYDGIGGSASGSAWDIADRTDTPAILVLRSKGQSISLAAQVMGFLHFRRPSHICGLLLTECSESLYGLLKPILERETGLPVLGYLPIMKAAQIPSRHLGLITADEIEDLKVRFDEIAGQMEKTLDVERILELFGGQESPYRSAAHAEELNCRLSDDGSGADCRIAVARDEAFCFYYSNSLEALREAGADPVFFSPIHDKCLPPHISGLYLGGGYPELYAKELSANKNMLADIKRAFDVRMPVIAECGGFLYLQKYLEDEDGEIHEMVGAFSGKGSPTGRLVRFGYLHMTAGKDSMLFRKGEIIPAHEFHHWDTDDNGTDLEAVRARGGQGWQCGYATDFMYAGFPHISLSGEIPFAARFVEAVRMRKCGGDLISK